MVFCSADAGGIYSDIKPPIYVSPGERTRCPMIMAFVCGGKVGTKCPA